MALIGWAARSKSRVCLSRVFGADLWNVAGVVVSCGPGHMPRQCKQVVIREGQGRKKSELGCQHKFLAKSGDASFARKVMLAGEVHETGWGCI